jgi:hypothetical protein
MPKKDSNFDKIILGISALAAIGGCGYLYSLSQSFSANLKLDKVTPRNEITAAPIESIKRAIGNLNKEFDWQPPERAGKAVPLFKSVTIVQKNGEQFDLYSENPQLRPPMSNAFLMKYSLDFLAPNVGALDPDEDGFSNEEEFNAATSPKDPKSHPPFTNHLFLVERVQDDYVLILLGNSPPYTVRRVKPPGARAQLISTFPQDFGFEPNPSGTFRFTAKKYEAKSVPDPKTQLPTDASEMTILDKSTNEEFVLVNKQEKNLAAFQAKLEYRQGTVQIITVKKGEKFRIPGLGSTFRLVDVLPDSAVIAESVADGTPEKTLTVQKRP